MQEYEKSLGSYESQEGREVVGSDFESTDWNRPKAGALGYARISFTIFP